MPTVLEICAGAGGQALGLETAGFECAAAIEIDAFACETLRSNRPNWRVVESDVKDVSIQQFKGIDLLAGGVPCPPFSIAGKQLGALDDRDVFPEALRLTAELRPRAVLLENVPGLASPKFNKYRKKLAESLSRLGYRVEWKIVNAKDFGVPQLRPRFIIVALRDASRRAFVWPEETPLTRNVGETLYDLMASREWPGAEAWAANAQGVAPTIVGGSKKHGGPDLGPTRARKQWLLMGVDGLGIADAPPSQDFPPNGLPRLTVRMAARIQGFPDAWQFAGKKTAAYRQVGNALPPPVAAAVGHSILEALGVRGRRTRRTQLGLFVDQP